MDAAARTWTVSTDGKRRRISGRDVLFGAALITGVAAGFVIGDGVGLVAAAALGLFASLLVRRIVLEPRPDLELAPEHYAQLDALLQQRGEDELREALAAGMLTTEEHEILVALEPRTRA